ncbi:uncharacterized protein FFE2_16078 [Fusarium fujikuroi]|nr:uncharacterized protein FFE2_16078 [Fusarium fujikuroi]
MRKVMPKAINGLNL